MSGCIQVYPSTCGHWKGTLLNLERCFLKPIRLGSHEISLPPKILSIPRLPLHPPQVQLQELVELEAGRRDHPGSPAGLLCSIGEFADGKGQSWEPNKSRDDCSTGLVLV